MVSQLRYRAATVYTVRNNARDDFQFLLEHPSMMGGTDYSVTGDDGAKIEKTKDGARVSVKLAAGKSVKLVVTETRIDQQRLDLKGDVGSLASWIQSNLTEAQSPLLRDEKLKAALALQTKIDGLKADLREQEELVKTLEGRQDTLRKNLTAAGENAPNRSEWLKKLDENATKIEQSQEKTQVTLKAGIKAAEKELRDALIALTIKWEEGK
jgi:hypothetical protein